MISSTASFTAKNCRFSGNITAGTGAEVTTAVEEIPSKWISAFPNPSGGKFTLSVPIHIGEYRMTIFDPMEKIVYQQSASGETQVEIPEAEIGPYIHVIESDRMTLVRKMVFK